MQEKNGVAYCASAFAANGCPPRAVCEGYSSTLHICSDGARYSVPAEEQSGAFLAAMQDQQLPLPAVLAALTTWCTGYPATLFWESRP